MDETIEILRRLWSEETIAYAGECFRFDAVCFEPKPLQKPGIPILVGGESPPAMRRAARIGDGWIMTYLLSVEDAREKVDALRALREECGRSGDPFEITGSVSRDVSVDALRRYGDAGIDRVVVDALGSRSAADVRETLQRFHDDVISKQ